MFDKLGIVTNCLAKRLADNDSFEKLIGDFVRNGFKQIEIRDGDYLRESAFGEFLGEIETTMQYYNDTDWQRFCVGVHKNQASETPGFRSQDLGLINRLDRFLQLSPGMVLSYAIAHPWTSPPENVTNDNMGMMRAKRLAYLFSPIQARLRLVDLNVKKPFDERAAVSNLRRYQSLMPECPVTLAVENSSLPPHIILDLAVQCNVRLAYDEANNFYQDGTTLGHTELFWERLKAHQLISIHLKQKNQNGVCARLGEGFVDLPMLCKHLLDRSYDGDWLLEYRATDQPLQDAIHNREFLLAYQNRKESTRDRKKK